MSFLYLNNAFSKKTHARVIDAINPLLANSYESPLTESAGGEEARNLLQKSRLSVASVLNAQPDEIRFVSSGTEANNWALKGSIAASRKSRNRIVISAMEHFSVFQTALYLKKSGVEVSVVPVDSSGLIDPDAVSQVITPETVVVSILAGSDEIGTIQDLNAIAGLKNRFPEVLFHTDAVQYLCYEALDVRSTPFDLVSFSANALYGPAGIAALFIREGTRVTPLLHGGVQEEGMRPGLQSLALIAGFGMAASINVSEKSQWKAELRSWQHELIALMDEFHVPVTGSRKQRLVDNVHVIVDVDGEAMITLLQEDEILASTGSTCSQYAQKESHVLKALGLSQEQARGAMLFTGSMDAAAETQRFRNSFTEALQSLRALKPW